MSELQVRLEVAGKMQLVGRLMYNSFADATFMYDQSYMMGNGSVPVSLSLPFQEEAFSVEKTKCFFEGLLPEGFTRRTVAQSLQIPENDYISLLHSLGNECLGALQIADKDYVAKSNYQKLTLAAIKKLAHEGSTKATEIILATHLSLAGASGKVGLYRNSDGNWYLPQGLAPSTHIVKQSHIRLQGLVTNEQLSLLTAKKLGLHIANCFIIDTGNKRDEDVLLASERYDRTMQGAQKRVAGLLCPLRLHQEDFAQALGIAAENKYEKPNDNYLKQMFELIYRNSANPILDAEELWKRIAFYYLLGNCDGHLKNNALLYSSNLRSIRLAPAYDIVSTVIYKPLKHNMSLYLVGECNLDKINRQTFALAAQEVGLGKRRALKIFDDLTNSFQAALTEATATLVADGFLDAEVISKKILKLGGIRKYI